MPWPPSPIALTSLACLHVLRLRTLRIAEYSSPLLATFFPLPHMSHACSKTGTFGASTGATSCQDCRWDLVCKMQGQLRRCLTGSGH